jgi:hypothetical protein
VPRWPRLLGRGSYDAKLIIYEDPEEDSDSEEDEAEDGKPSATAGANASAAKAPSKSLKQRRREQDERMKNRKIKETKLEVCVLMAGACSLCFQTWNYLVQDRLNGDGIGWEHDLGLSASSLQDVSAHVALDIFILRCCVGF